MTGQNGYFVTKKAEPLRIFNFFNKKLAHIINVCYNDKAVV